jgi:TolB-like protein/DNA-binding winged helix-turn-helix (wHTH) protein
MADISVDTGTRQVSRDGTVLQIGGLSYDLLLALLRRAPNVATSGELMGEVWCGRIVNDETVAKRVELLRAALGDDSREARYIAVVRGRGYRVIAPVETLAAAPGAVGATASPPTPGISRRAKWVFVAIALATVAELAWWLWPRGPTPPAHPVLAVLPLANLSEGNTGEYFAEAMHDALIADLSRASGIKVISRTSTLPYRDSGKSLGVIAKELGVNLVMEGSVLRADERVRITLQLLDASDSHLWAENYEGDLRDVLKLQSDVARAVAQAVKVKLSPTESARLGARRAINVASYDRFLEGKKLMESANPADFEAGIAQLTRAAELDPTSALPYARLAMAYSMRAHAPGAGKSLYPRATAYALQAIGLDPDLADGHEALAEMRLYFHWDWPGAEASFRRVFELSPSFAPAHAHYGWLRVLHGDFPGAIAELRLASQLDPRFPVWPSWLAWVQMLSGDAAGAERELLRVVRDFAPSAVAWHVLGQVYLTQQRTDDAIAAFRRAGDLDARWSWGLGQGLAAAGKLDEARALAKQLESRAHPDAWAIAEVYCATGDLEQAAEWIERGYEARRDWIPWIKANTFFAPLRDHPRFREVVRRLDLPH